MNVHISWSTQFSKIKPVERICSPCAFKHQQEILKKLTGKEEKEITQIHNPKTSFQEGMIVFCKASSGSFSVEDGVPVNCPYLTEHVVGSEDE